MKKQTTKAKKNKFRIAQYSMVAGEYVSVATPYIIMGAINFDEWFVFNPEGWKIGLGGILGLAVLGLAMFLITKNKEKEEKISNGMISLVIGWYVIAFVFFLLAKVNMEIYTIMFYGGFGLLGALGLNIGAKNFDKKAKALTEAMEEAEKEIVKEDYKKEIKEQEKPQAYE